MKIALLPFEASRIDRAQGVFGRQIPALLADLLVDAGLDALYVPWFAERAGRLTHVLVEGPLPDSVVSGEQSRAQADVVVTGRVRVAPDDRTLRVDVHGLTGADRALVAEGGAETSLLALVRELTGRLLAALETDAPEVLDRLPVTEDGFRYLLFDRDNDAIVRAAGPHSLASTPDAWRHLLAAAEVEDSDALLDRLRDRIARWRREEEEEVADEAEAAIDALIARRDPTPGTAG